MIQSKLDTKDTTYPPEARDSWPATPAAALSGTQKALLHRAEVPPHQKSQSSAFQTTPAFLPWFLFGSDFADLLPEFSQISNCQRLSSKANLAKHLQYDPFVSDLQSTMSPRCFVHIESGTMPPMCLFQAACSQRGGRRRIRKPSMSHALFGSHNKDQADLFTRPISDGRLNQASLVKL